MKKTIKKIVSGIASIVLGFSTITSLQSFAENGTIDKVKLAYHGEGLAVVPSENGASKMEGIASDGDNIYAVKIDENETVAKIHRYNLKGERVGSGNLPGTVGHANDMTAVKYEGKTHLFVLQHNSTTTKIHHFTVDKNGKDKDKYTKLTKYTVKGVYNGIAAKVDNNKSNQATCVFYLTTNNGQKLYNTEISLTNKKDMTLGCYLVCDTGIIDDWRPQGIAYNKGYMYMAFSEEKGGEKKYDNVIYSFKVGKDDLNAYPVNLDSNCKKNTSCLEIESCVIVDKYIYFNTNSRNKDKKINYDGIYKIIK